MATAYHSGWREMFERTADISGNFIVEGLTEQIQQLNQLLASNPEMDKKMRRVISKVMIKAQKKIQKELASDPALRNDPRNAAKAVRKAVYRNLLGGNINILRKSRATDGVSTYTPTRTLRTGQRGGNRMLRSERTQRMESYNASDRGFILYWLNSGTNERRLQHFRNDSHRTEVKRGSQGGDRRKYGQTMNTGRRGRIKPHNIFASRLISMGDYINQELMREFGNLIKEST